MAGNRLVMILVWSVVILGLLCVQGAESSRVGNRHKPRHDGDKIKDTRVHVRRKADTIPGEPPESPEQALKPDSPEQALKPNSSFSIVLSRAVHAVPGSPFLVTWYLKRREKRQRRKMNRQKKRARKLKKKNRKRKRKRFPKRIQKQRRRKVVKNKRRILQAIRRRRRKLLFSSTTPTPQRITTPPQTTTTPQTTTRQTTVSTGLTTSQSEKSSKFLTDSAQITIVPPTKQTASGDVISSAISGTTSSRPSPTPTTSTPATTTSDTAIPEDSTGEEFDIGRVTRLFKATAMPATASETNDIAMESYIKAYRELLKIFDYFGTVWSFAKDDVLKKLEILTDNLDSDREHYATFGKMFEYETSNGFSKSDYIGPNESGIRANAWIHRGLRFIELILGDLTTKDHAVSLSSKASEFYTQTMAPFHSWYVRMGVKVALVSFPSREQLIASIAKSKKDGRIQDILELSKAVRFISDTAHDFYNKYEG